VSCVKISHKTVTFNEAAFMYHTDTKVSRVNRVSREARHEHGTGKLLPAEWV